MSYFRDIHICVYSACCQTANSKDESDLRLTHRRKHEWASEISHNNGRRRKRRDEISTMRRRPRAAHAYKLRAPCTLLMTPTFQSLDSSASSLVFVLPTPCLLGAIKLGLNIVVFGVFWCLSYWTTPNPNPETCLVTTSYANDYNNSNKPQSYPRWTITTPK